MFERVKAVYRGGTFVPSSPCDLPEGAEVELAILGPSIFPPEVRNPEERWRILSAIVEQMQHNPLATEAPRLTREELHDRR